MYQFGGHAAVVPLLVYLLLNFKRGKRRRGLGRKGIHEQNYQEKRKQTLSWNQLREPLKAAQYLQVSPLYYALTSLLQCWLASTLSHSEAIFHNVDRVFPTDCFWSS